MDTTEAIRISKNYLDYLRTNNYKIMSAYLFGSYAKGNYREESDIDIAIIFSELQDSIDMQIDLMKQRRKFDLRIEPHPFSHEDLSASIPLLEEILKNGLAI